MRLGADWRKIKDSPLNNNYSEQHCRIRSRGSLRNDLSFVRITQMIVISKHLDMDVDYGKLSLWMENHGVISVTCSHESMRLFGKKYEV